jgi:hypothetical protein
MNEKPTMSAEEEYALTKRRKTGQASERWQAIMTSGYETIY